MKLPEIAHMLRVARPPAPDGAWNLARCSSIEEVARRARRRLPAGARAYLEGGSEDEHTLRRNREALDRLELLPRQPRDVRGVDTSTTILGEPSPLPIVLSPVGGPRMFHHEGELAVARAARRAGIPYGISTLGTTAVEDVAAQTDSPLWFQLYVWGDRATSKKAVIRAKRAGYRVLLLSLDTNVRSKREREKRSGLELPNPELPVTTVLEGALHPDWSWHFLTSPTISFPNIGPADQRSLDPGAVGRPDRGQGGDTRRGGGRGGRARRRRVVVSNHGGRQLDHVPATVDALPGIVDAVGDRLEVMVDSGFRRGTDIAAALALGARAVLVGPAHLYGLAAAGEAGVRHCIEILAEELRTTMQLCGVRTVAELDRGLLRRSE